MSRPAEQSPYMQGTTRIRQRTTSPLNFSGLALQWLYRNPIWLFALFLSIVFSASNSFFFTPYNLSNILFQSALIGFLAIGLTPIIISGHIDLTVGSVVGLSACLIVGLQTSLGLGPAFGITLLAGLTIGLVNGLLVERLGISSFIITLAGMIGIRGVAFLYAGDSSLSTLDEQLYNWSALTIGPVSAIPLSFMVLALVCHWLLKRTAYGRSVYAIGGSRSAARDAGVRINLHIVASFALCGAMAAFCGIAMAANLGAATPSYGKDYELWAVTAVVLGGAKLRGGKGGIPGTVAAVICLAMLQNGLNLLHVSPFYITVIMGLALIAALAIDRQVNRRNTPAGE